MRSFAKSSDFLAGIFAWDLKEVDSVASNFIIKCFLAESVVNGSIQLLVYLRLNPFKIVILFIKSSL